MASIIDYKTKIIFGKDALDSLTSELKDHKVKKLLMVYGGGSIKRNGIYDKIVSKLKKANIEWEEFNGIEPNPRHTTIDKAADIVRKNNHQFILAVGGGSVIDASKIIAAQAVHNWDSIWLLADRKVQIMKEINIKVGAIVTLAATASENNANSVVSNMDTQEKYGCVTKPPVFAIENPEFTYTVNQWQTASGAYDIFCHVLENYFGAKEFDYADNIAMGLLKTLKKNVPLALKNPKNYEARANILITSSFALNGVYAFRRKEIGADWFTHWMEHAISAIWDVTHGAGLALVHPYYMEFASKKSDFFAKRLAHFGQEVFNVKGVNATIKALREMIKLWGLPQKYSDFKEIKSISDEQYAHMTSHVKGKNFLKLEPKEVESIFRSIKL